jgi:hypothetical protein
VAQCEREVGDGKILTMVVDDALAKLLSFNLKRTDTSLKSTGNNFTDSP